MPNSTTEITPRAQGARPFVKWVGGKGHLLDVLVEEVRRAGIDAYTDYYEPFVGGGALFWELNRLGIVDYKGYRNILLSDTCAPLIWAYRAIQLCPDMLIEGLKFHAQNHAMHSDPRPYYLDVRESFNKRLGCGWNFDWPMKVACAVDFLYLNKTCFNGLWRVNLDGKFNVNMGAYKNPRICDEENISCCHDILSLITNASDMPTLACLDADYVVSKILSKGSRSLCYFDPPYVPASPTANFTSYSALRFGLEAHKRLAESLARLTNAGHMCILSNSDTPLVHELYRGFNITKVHRPGTVNSAKGKRGKVGELVITNF